MTLTNDLLDGRGVEAHPLFWPSHPAKSLPQLLDWYDKLRSDKTRRWLFRGQEEASWPLEPRLERTLLRFGIDRREMRKYERFVLREGQRHLHRIITAPPSINDWAEWIGLLQHYGSPTRFLDWTYSFFVALYFAIEKADPKPKNGSPRRVKIFAMDNIQLVTIRQAKYEVRLPRRIKKKHKDNDKDPEVLKYFLEKDMPDLDFVLPINPFRLNERLAIQQGIFLFCPTTLRPFSEVYNEMRSNYTGLTSEIEIEVSLEFMTKCLAYLQGLNMTSTTLFPGIDGLCRGLEHKIAVDSNWNLL